MKRTGTAVAMLGVIAAFIAGRWSVGTTDTRSTSRESGTSPDYTVAWRVVLRTGDQPAPGSTKAVNDLEALHGAGKLVGSDARIHAKVLRLAREIRFLRDRIQFEMLCMDKPDGHYGLIDVDPPTGRVVRAEFGEYPF